MFPKKECKRQDEDYSNMQDPISPEGRRQGSPRGEDRSPRGENGDSPITAGGLRRVGLGRVRVRFRVRARVAVSVMVTVKLVQKLPYHHSLACEQRPWLGLGLDE